MSKPDALMQKNLDQLTKIGESALRGIGEELAPTQAKLMSTSPLWHGTKMAGIWAVTMYFLMGARGKRTLGLAALTGFIAGYSLLVIAKSSESGEFSKHYLY